MFDSEIAAASQRYQVPESWIRAVIETESNWKPNAFRAEPQIQDASYGLMQLLHRTAKGLGYDGSTEGLYTPGINIDLGTKLLGTLRQKYGDDFRQIYSAYNSGSPSRWLTSKEVAAHVERAVHNLTHWVSTEMSTVTASPDSSAIVGLLILVLLWSWTGKRR